MEDDTEITMVCLACQGQDIGFFISTHGFNLYRCRSCKLIFVHPLPMDTGYLYSSDYFSGAEKGFGYVSYEEDKEAMKDVFCSYLDRIESLCHDKGRLLDVGAANGYFLKLAKDRGWKVSGVEVSDYAASEARRSGLDVWTGKISDLKSAPGSFDVITLWDVIEHVLDPLLDVQIMSNLLKPGGLLALNTPDGHSLFARIMGGKWHQLIPPEHLFYFNPYSMGLLMKQCDFTPLLDTKIGKKFTLRYVIHVVSHWQKIKLPESIKNFLKSGKPGDLYLPINLRDNFFMVFRKNG